MLSLKTDRLWLGAAFQTPRMFWCCRRWSEGVKHFVASEQSVDVKQSQTNEPNCEGVYSRPRAARVVPIDKSPVSGVPARHAPARLPPPRVPLGSLHGFTTGPRGAAARGVLGRRGASCSRAATCKREERRYMEYIWNICPHLVPILCYRV